MGTLSTFDLIQTNSGRGNVFMPTKMLDHVGQLWPGSCQTEHTWNPHCELGEAVAQVLNESIPTCDDAATARLLEPTHRRQPLFEMPMVAFNAIVEVLRCPMLNAGENHA